MVTSDKAIMVSILCLVFNHKEFLRKCLDGFVNQITNFNYEIIIHDDCSTDGSIEIIKEYENKYPNITVIYETENQYSKGVSILKDILYPYIKSKYIAFCEGDDYWNDCNKLQKQFDYMESHAECSLCVHNTIKRDLLNKEKDTLFNNWKQYHVLNEEEIVLEWKVHTSSYFFRYDSFGYEFVLPGVWCGDYAMLLYAFTKGYIMALPDIMSVYNLNNTSGVTFTIKTAENRILRNQERCAFLENFNKYTQGKYELVVNKRICRCIIAILLSKIILEMKDNFSFLSYRKAREKVIKLPLYNMYFEKASMFNKLKGFLVFNSFLLLYIVKRIYFKNAI